jgi:hypothetical protein
MIKGENMDIIDGINAYANTFWQDGAGNEHFDIVKSALDRLYGSILPIDRNAQVPVSWKAEVQFEQRCEHGLRTPILKRVIV